MIKIAKQLISQMSLPKQQDADVAAATPLTTWYLKPITVGHTSMAVFINEATLAPVIIPPLDILAVPATNVFQNILGSSLHSQFVNDDKLGRYLAHCTASQQAVDNISTNFQLERVYQEFASELRGEKMDLTNDQEVQHLFQHINVLMDKLVEHTSFFKKDPFIQLGELVNRQIRIPAHAATSKDQAVRDLRAKYDQFSDQQFLSKDDAGFSDAVEGIRALNEQLMAHYKKWLYDVEDEPFITSALLIASKYLNSYLLDKNPQSVFDDLTAPTDFLFSWRTKDNADGQLYHSDDIAALMFLAHFLNAQGYWGDEDFKTFELAVESSGQGHQPGFEQGHGQTSAAKEFGPDTLVALFKELFKPEYSQLLDHLLADLSDQQRQSLLQRLQKLDH